VRVVIDPGVVVSAMISERGAPGRLLLAWDAGEFELVVSPMLLAELERVLSRPDIHRRITREHAVRVIRALRSGAIEAPDPGEQPSVTRDPKDDYLVALARAAGADFIVSGDRDLLEADVRPAVLTPRELLELTQPS
jgi:putative PIN family toxin of toxin-antitoxin system